MDIFVLPLLVALGAYLLKSQDERKRIALLATYLGNYQIEKLMESLTEGYLRALGEEDPERRAQIWHLLGSTETQLCNQFNAFVAEFSKTDALQARMSRLPISLPYAGRLFPSATLDLRKLLSLHAQGISRAARNTENRTPKAKAFTVSAEIFLMQHSCHWFCKSKTVASARMQLRHQTSHAQLLAAVSPETRRDYMALLRLD